MMDLIHCLYYQRISDPSFQKDGLVRLIKAGAPVNISSESNTEPLLNALYRKYFSHTDARDDKIELIRSLIAAGYNFNASYNGDNSFSLYMQLYHRLYEQLPFKIFAPMMIEQGGASLVTENACANPLLVGPISDGYSARIDFDDFKYLISKDADLLSKCGGYTLMYNFIPKEQIKCKSVNDV